MNDAPDRSERRVELRQVTSKGSLDEVRQLFSEYARSLETDLAFQNFETERRTLPGKYAPPGGVLLAACVEGRAAGCIALRKLSDTVCEMKRLYVRDAYRGMGIGRQLIAALIKEAVRLHYHSIRLDTLPTMQTAQALYWSFGFHEIEPYVYNPVPGTKFMELDVTP